MCWHKIIGIPELQANSFCNSGFFWAKSAKASAKACCVTTTWWKCEEKARVKRSIAKYLPVIKSFKYYGFLVKKNKLRWVSLSCSIWASNSESTVRCDLPNFSSIIWRVHLYVDTLQFLIVSNFEAPWRSRFESMPLCGLRGDMGVGVVGAAKNKKNWNSFNLFCYANLTLPSLQSNVVSNLATFKHNGGKKCKRLKHESFSE